MAMGTKHADIFAALAAPFEPGQVKERSEGGRSMKYITARTAMNRLDEVLGPENWTDDPIPYMDGTGSFLCKLTITLPDGSKVTKSGVGGGKAKGTQATSPPKDSESDAFKRAAVKFGIARYLYRDGVPKFVQERYGAGPGQHAPATAPDGRQQVNETFRPPAQGGRPEGSWSGQRPDRTQSDHSGQRPGVGGNGGHAGGHSYGDRPPTSGKGLFAWCKRIEEEQEVGMLKYLNEWSKMQEFPGRMVDWDAEQVALAHKEALRKLGNRDDRGDAYEDAPGN